MQLQVSKRPRSTKGVRSQLRREGGVPAVLYAKGKESQTLTINRADIQKILRELKPGTLSTLVLELQGMGSPIRAIIKEMQYQKTSYDVLHVDLLELLDGQPVRVNVPVELTGVAESIAVKAGGVIRQVARQVAVECLPGDIPREFFVDVRDLEMVGSSKRVKSIGLNQGVKMRALAEDVLAVVAKR